jgi:hypothetical protein
MAGARLRTGGAVRVLIVTIRTPTFLTRQLGLGTLPECSTPRTGACPGRREPEDLVRRWPAGYPARIDLAKTILSAVVVGTAV